MEKAYNTILYQKDETVPNIVYITLNRPEKRNAISIGPNEMTGEVQDAIKRVDSDDEVKVAIFRGAGESFCAGFDLSMVYRVYGGSPEVIPAQAIRLRTDEDQLMGMRKAILNCKKVTMAQVHGWCIEAGMYVAESSDISIAAKNAKFAHRGQRLAFGGMIQPFYLVMGLTKKITELVITGRTISGEQAEQIGIITKAVEPEDLSLKPRPLASWQFSSRPLFVERTTSLFVPVADRCIPVLGVSVGGRYKIPESLSHKPDTVGPGGDNERFTPHILASSGRFSQRRIALFPSKWGTQIQFRLYETGSEKGQIKFPTSEESMAFYDVYPIVGGTKEDGDIG